MKDLKDLLKDNEVDFSEETNFIMFKEETTIKLPFGLIKDLKKDFKHKDLKCIHNDRDTALELIYIVLSNFTLAWVQEVKFKDNYVDNNYIQLSSILLKKQVGTGSDKARYKIILETLICHKYIERGLGYKLGLKSISYKINDKYHKTKIEKYILNSEYTKKRYKKNIREKLILSLNNVIALNELQNLNRIELPSLEEVKKHLKYYSKRKWKNKKGKQLKVLGKKKRLNQFIYVEDYVKLYQILNENFHNPKILGENAGHRIATKFNLMPSLIRELFKLRDNGQKMIGLDFSCFHPNLAIRKLQGANNQIVTHEEVAEFLKTKKKYSKNTDVELRQIAKKEHLSFFNKEVKHMKNSKIYSYYEEKHPELLSKVEKDKIKKGYKNTSRMLFTAETKIMTEIIKRCQAIRITTIYVYDELLVEESHVDEVKKILEQVCIEQKLNVDVK
jgi:hypothetical protein